MHFLSGRYCELPWPAAGTERLTEVLVVRECITYLLQHFRTKELRSICNKRNTYGLIKTVVLNLAVINYCRKILHTESADSDKIRMGIRCRNATLKGQRRLKIFLQLAASSLQVSLKISTLPRMKVRTKITF